MKRIFLLSMLFILSCLTFVSCEKEQEAKGYKDIEVEYFDGEWSMISNAGYEGTIEFDRDNETFTMDSRNGKIEFGTFSLNPDKVSLGITYMEDEEGNDLMEDYYETGYNISFKVIDSRNCELKNVPFYQSTTIKIYK